MVYINTKHYTINNTVLWYQSLGYSWQRNNESRSPLGTYCPRWTFLCPSKVTFLLFTNIRAVPHTFATVWQSSRQPFANNHRRLSLHGYQDSFGLHFHNNGHQRPLHKYILCATFFAGEQYLHLVLGLFWQPMCCPHVNLHQRPFKNVTSSMSASNSTHRHNDPTQGPFRRENVTSSMSASNSTHRHNDPTQGPFRQEKFTHTTRDTSLASVTLESPPSTWGRALLYSQWTPVTTTSLRWLPLSFPNPHPKMILESILNPLNGPPTMSSTHQVQ